MDTKEKEIKSKKPEGRLGRGLGAIISGNSTQNNKETKNFNDSKGDSNSNTDSNDIFIEISKIKRNPYQPRHDFEPIAMSELVDSIKTYGVMQAITVRKSGDRYELISGERRLKASTEAGLTKIPAYIIDANEEQMMALALIENLQREDLNPVEIGLGFQKLIDEYKLTHEEVAEKVGKPRSSVSNFLRILNLPQNIVKSLREKQISLGHAKSLLSIENTKIQSFVWQKIIEDELSVRAAESLAKKLVNENLNPKENKKDSIDSANPYVEQFEEKFRTKLGTDVKIKSGKDNSGWIEIKYFSSDDLERLTELIVEK